VAPEDWDAERSFSIHTSGHAGFKATPICRRPSGGHLRLTRSTALA
jgi:hypothetical protein